MYILANIEVHVMCAMDKYATKELNGMHNMDVDKCMYDDVPMHNMDTDVSMPNMDDDYVCSWHRQWYSCAQHGQ